MTTNSDHPLDNPVRSALRGPQAELAESYRSARRYPDDVSPFAARPVDGDEWQDLATLVGAGGFVVMAGLEAAPPADWELTMEIPGVQLVGDSVAGSADAFDSDGAVRLTRADVPEMLDLVERTRPGPFLPRTIELGTYLGVRRGGALVAMAGERFRPAGWTEISAVCTDPDFRGQGLGTRLVLAVALGIRARGETPLMHAAGSNENAIRLYTSLGFTQRREISFRGLVAPAAPTS
ncbi:FR47-like protein [Jatrophihabitans sp. GAS493]|uniref:GNAT family N-acetyltransferase n=1 Tax=Jatrophihabitans sp. GAS493 TaxID=1907575 RepID=UPI000BB84443|nr:GNAT family N-acetyltransferase [Jatrophihabitans sp. GAS493]SOD71484.1 FR47-like protein [Jatrophihabitans sp. GAS493]